MPAAAFLSKPATEHSNIQFAGRVRNQLIMHCLRRSRVLTSAIMRIVLLTFALAVTVVFQACARANFQATALSVPGVQQPASFAPSVTAPARIDFATQIRPILEARCQPCHFRGGKMYERLPFDRPETVKTLGTKLFTRIKDEKEQALIRQFLAQQ
jgi:hypothetical protein